MLIEILLRVGPFAAFATAVHEIRDRCAHCEVVTKWRTAPSRFARQVFLLNQAHLYLTKLSFSVGSSCVDELVHIEIPVRLRRGATATTNIVRATVARFRIYLMRKRIFHTQQTLIEQRSGRKQRYDLGTACEETCCWILLFKNICVQRCVLDSCRCLAWRCG